MELKVELNLRQRMELKPELIVGQNMELKPELDLVDFFSFNVYELRVAP